MTNPILPDYLSHEHKFNWDLNSVLIQKEGKDSIASVQVLWKDQIYTIRVRKDGEFKDLKEAQEALKQQIDTAILLMARYGSPDVKQLNYDQEHLTKFYKDRTKYSHRERPRNKKIDFDYDAQWQKQDTRLKKVERDNPNSEDFYKTSDRISRIREASELKQMLKSKGVAPSKNPISVRAEEPVLRELQGLQQENERLRQAMGEAKRDITQKEEEYQAGEAKLHGLIKEREARLDGLATHFDKFKTETEQKQREIAERSTTLEQEKARLLQQISTLQEEKRQHEVKTTREIDDLKRQQQELEKLKTSLQEDKADASKKQRELEERSKTLDQQNERLRQQVSQIQEQNRLLEAKTTEEASKMRGEIDALTSQQQRLEELNKALQSEKADASKKQRELEERSAILDQQNVQLLQQISKFQEEKRRLQAEMAGFKEDAAKMHTAFEALKAEKQHLEEQYKSLQKEKDDSASQLGAYKAEIDNMHKEFEVLKQEKQRLEAHVKALKKENLDLDARLSRPETDNISALVHKGRTLVSITADEEKLAELGAREQQLTQRLVDLMSKLPRAQSLAEELNPPQNPESALGQLEHWIQEEAPLLETRPQSPPPNIEPSLEEIEQHQRRERQLEEELKRLREAASSPRPPNPQDEVLVKELQQVKQRLRHLSEEKAKLEEKIADREELLKENLKLEAELEQAKTRQPARLKELETLNAEQREKLQEFDAEFNKKQEQIRQLNEKIRALQKKDESSARAFDDLRSSAGEEEELHRNAIQRLEQQQKELESERKKAVEEAERTRAELEREKKFQQDMITYLQHVKSYLEKHEDVKEDFATWMGQQRREDQTPLA